MVDPRTKEAVAFTTDFAKRTGLISGVSSRRYLWTDAFAVCNLLGLARSTGEKQYSLWALRLIDEVHHTLGRQRHDYPGEGWISGLSEDEGEAHPTQGGLRIGKRYPMKIMGRAEARRAGSLQMLSAQPLPGPASMAAGLRRHASRSENFARHSNADICMHADGITRPGQTTASTVAALRPGEPPEIYVTGTSVPCLSVFQPISFRTCQMKEMKCESSKFDLGEGFERVHQRALCDTSFRRYLSGSRDRLGVRIFDTEIDIEKRRDEARQWHREWIERAENGGVGYRCYLPYDRFWHARS
jgi:hypothetical protein